MTQSRVTSFVSANISRRSGASVTRSSSQRRAVARHLQPTAFPCEIHRTASGGSSLGTVTETASIKFRVNR